MEIRFLEPDEWYLIESLFERQGAPVPDPKWAKVLVAIDGGKVVGTICMQLVLHAEPIIVDRKYQGKGLAQELSEVADGYMQACGVTGAYTQPLREGAKRIARAMGYEEAEAPLYVKIYDSRYERLVPQEEEE